MKRMVLILVFCCMLNFTACNTKAKEEALAQTTEVVSALGDISFTLNGYWSLQQGEEIEGMNLDDSQIYDFLATHIESSSNVSIIYDDLTKIEGGTLVRIDDYANAVWESLKTSSEYTYDCSEIVTEKLHGKEYLTFSSEITELGGTQHFYIRRIDDNMMIMIITLYGEDSLEDILNLSK